jgi:hypothetical protein
MSAWFTVDILACIPFGVLGSAFEDSGNKIDMANLQ